MEEIDDPCGEAMKPHMDRMLRELVAGGPPHAEWERLKRVEAAARKFVQAAHWASSVHKDSALDELRAALGRE